jgi:hypothetical protein
MVVFDWEALGAANREALGAANGDAPGGADWDAPGGADWDAPEGAAWDALSLGAGVAAVDVESPGSAAAIACSWLIGLPSEINIRDRARIVFVTPSLRSFVGSKRQANSLRFAYKLPVSPSIATISGQTKL